MKNAKRYLTIGIALTIALFISGNALAMIPGDLAGMIVKHEAEIHVMKTEIEILKRTVERLVAAEKLAATKR